MTGRPAWGEYKLVDMVWEGAYACPWDAVELDVDRGEAPIRCGAIAWTDSMPATSDEALLAPKLEGPAAEVWACSAPAVDE